MTSKGCADHRTPPRNWPRWSGYAFSIAATASVPAVQPLLDLGQPILPILFLPPIILSAYLGGSGPALTATVLGSVGTAYFLFSPALSDNLATSHDIGHWLLFILNGILISALAGRRATGRT